MTELNEISANIKSFKIYKLITICTDTSKSLHFKTIPIDSRVD